MPEFNGLHEDMYRFFWELAFHNDPAFFEENRARYVREVKDPLYALALNLLPTALEMDPNFTTKLSGIVSRIRRDTRYSHDKSPYRDHAWLGFRYPGNAVSESFTPYIEFERESYGYGMGMYAPDAKRMADIRARILAAPETFLSLAEDRAFAGKFTVEGESFKRVRYPNENPIIESFLNRRNLSFCYSSPELKRTTRPEILDECRAALQLMTPMYQFLTR